MRLLSLVLTSLRRHWLRAAIGASGVAFGVAAMLAILGIVTGAIGMFRQLLATDSDYLVFERNVSDLFFSSVTAPQIAAVRNRPEVAEAHPILFGVVSSADHPVVTCFGLEQSDPRLQRATWLAGRREDFGARADEVFLGSRAAEFLHGKLGGEIAIGRANFRVGGILRTENGFEDGGVFLPLAAAQRFFSRGDSASIVTVKLHDPAQGAGFQRAIAAAEPEVVALENREFAAGYNTFKILNVTAWAVGVCAFCLGGLGVANTMLLSVFSRIREIAVLRVCGFSRSQIVLLIFGEAFVVAVLGCAAGLALGFAALAGVEHVPQFQGYVQPALPASVLAGIVATAITTAALGALYPAHFASRIQPAEALRYE